MDWITGETFLDAVLRSDRPVVVVFWSDDHQSCQDILPLLQRLETEVPGVKIVRVNAKDSTTLVLTDAFSVRVFPTCFLIAQGHAIDVAVGCVWRFVEELVLKGLAISMQKTVHHFQRCCCNDCLSQRLARAMLN